MRSYNNHPDHKGLTKKLPSEYNSWKNMINRCYNEENNNYAHYGGRSITVYDRWRFGENNKTGFECFIDDLGKKPFNSYSLDRINVNGNYDKINCRWANRTIQALNKRNSIALQYRQGFIPLKHLCKKVA